MTARTVLPGGGGADLDLACATVCPALDLRCATACPLRPTFHGGGVALDPISLSRIHEDLRLERHKHMPHSSECTWHMLHTFRARRFMAAAWLWIRYHSQESMKTSASKGRSRCHTPASVQGICFMPFKADLFMAAARLWISSLSAGGSSAGEEARRWALT